jgi:hypothetical protein
MFKLTREEQLIVAFLLIALVLGTAVGEWRLRHPNTAAVTALETKGH